MSRGKQKEFLGLVIGESLTSRETGLLARKYLSAKSAQEEKYLVKFTLSGVKKVIFFSFILGYSHRQYIELVQDKTQPVLLRAMINAFTRWGGIPLQVRSDNQKACVERWELGRPVFNKTYLGFCTHYRFEPQAIHPGCPRENLKVERPLHYLEKNFLNMRKFRDRDDLRGQLEKWLDRVNDQRVRRTTGRRPAEMHAEELPLLQLLPREGYDTSQTAYRVVNGESAIQWENHYNMVPRGYLYETCPVWVDGGQITIYTPSCAPLVSNPLAGKGERSRYVGHWEPTGRKRGLSQKVAIDIFLSIKMHCIK